MCPIKHKNSPAMEPATAASCHSHDLGEVRAVKRAVQGGPLETQKAEADI